MENIIESIDLDTSDGDICGFEHMNHKFPLFDQTGEKACAINLGFFDTFLS